MSQPATEVDMVIHERVPLEGAELKEYEEEARKQQQRQFSEVAMKAQVWPETGCVAPTGPWGDSPDSPWHPN